MSKNKKEIELSETTQPEEAFIEQAEEETEINWEQKCQLLQNNLESAYEKIRYLEKQMSEKAVKDRSSDMLISQAVSVLSNTIMLAIKNKEN